MGVHRFFGRAAVLAVATTFLVAVGVQPAWAAPAVVATPHSDLVDRQTITVTGSGFPANSSVGVAQCGPGVPTSLDDCDLSTLVITAADTTGAFTADLRVHRIINTSTDADVDCAGAPGRCHAAAATFDLATTASTPLDFDPTVAPLPPLEIGLHFVSAAVKDNVVLLRGTVTCNQPATVDLQGRVRQVVQRFFINGFFGTTVDCAGDEPFAVVFEGDNGVLKRGAAELDISATGATTDGESGAATLGADIRLKAK